MTDQLIKAIEGYENYISAKGVDENVVKAYSMAAAVAIEQEKDVENGLNVSKRAKELIERFTIEQTGGTIWDLEKYAQANGMRYDLVDRYYEVLKLESYDLFESFIYYMEQKRPFKKRFYQPRRKTLKIVVDDLQELEDGKIEFYGLSMPSRVGKSTICIFFLAWVSMRKPDSHNAMGGHSGRLAKRFYKGLMNLFATEEYMFSELFTYWNKGLKVLEDKSLEDFTINLGHPDEFSTITCRGIDGTWTGAVDVSDDGYLYVDDLIRDRTHSLNPTRMEETYQEYLNKMVDRKNDGAKELMVGTLWNVLDPLERIRKENEDNPFFRFRKIPALDENDESNFNYDVKGFSTEYYKRMRDRLDKNEWMAKYQQMPFVREGLLFPLDELNYYNGVLPDGECLRVAACDVSWGGGDSLSMPFGDLYGEREDGPIYIKDWIFNRGDKYVTKPLVVAKCIQHKPNSARFEANNGGDEYAESIDVMLQDEGFKTNVSWVRASNQIGKMAKIIQFAPDIKRRCYFLEPKLQSEEYRKAMEELGMIVQIGKNPHEDSADSLAQLMQLITGDVYAKCEAMQRPF